MAKGSGGSGRAGGAPAGSAMSRYEAKIADYQRESAAVFTPSGQLIGTVPANNRNFAQFPKELRDQMAGNVVIHNHPGGTPFSSADLANLGKYNPKQIVVVGRTPSGTRYRYTLSAKRGTSWPSWDLARSTFESAEKRNPLPSAGGTHRQYVEALSRHYHGVWKDVARTLGLSYSRRAF